ncbi:MAG: Holliday junction branch migration DNA helicase RuvB [Candidatus Onthovivens sp.]|nr:Holliday junction branch migration DNA helicase RuvB [Candidatus Onthovivens sp.]
MKQQYTIRPTNLEEFVGNSSVTSLLKIYISSAKERKVSMDHTMLYGPPGVGKTSLANVIANELNVNIVSISAINIKFQSDLITILTSIQENDVLFIDEIHRLDKEIEEMLYKVMEDFKISINYKAPEGTKILELDVEPFTLIGATTILGNVSKPLRDRFPITFKLDLYSDNEITDILKNVCNKQGILFDTDGLLEIAKRSKKTPRIALNFLKRIYDISLYEKKTRLTKDFTKYAFTRLKIDEYGLTQDDYRIIKILYENYENRPVSLKSIAIIISESEINLENYYEPYLISQGIIERTKQGRRLTKYGVSLYKNAINL